jgi:SAM-dependent methyltransferase
MNDSDFIRYLAAKKTIDDRSLNTHVWATFERLIAPLAEPRVLELGGGIGTMVERFAARGLLSGARYTLIDEQHSVIDVARSRTAGLPIAATCEVADARAYLRGARGQFDVVVAHAFLDLFRLGDIVPLALGALKPGGVFYFSVNFDGATLLQPEIDRAYDDEIEMLYHRTMDERVTDGVRSGDSRSGRHLFGQLRAAGADIHASGASDWVVFAGSHGYVDDDAFFLRCILGFFEDSVGRRPEIDRARFAAWLAERHAQMARGDLIYIAHQLDFVGRASPGASQ